MTLLSLKKINSGVIGVGAPFILNQTRQAQKDILYDSTKIAPIFTIVLTDEVKGITTKHQIIIIISLN